MHISLTAVALACASIQRDSDVLTAVHLVKDACGLFRGRAAGVTELAELRRDGVWPLDAVVTTVRDDAGVRRAAPAALEPQQPGRHPRRRRSGPVARALEIAAGDPDADGMLVVLTPQDMTDPTQTAEAVARHARVEGKPVLDSWMGGPTVQAGEAILNRAGIPTFAYPDTAARAFHYMWRYTYHLRGLYETPALDAARPAAERVIAAARWTCPPSSTCWCGSANWWSSSRG